jgi:hypothetical protein
MGAKFQLTALVCWQAAKFAAQTVPDACFETTFAGRYVMCILALEKRPAAQL